MNFYDSSFLIAEQKPLSDQNVVRIKRIFAEAKERAREREEAIDLDVARDCGPPAHVAPARQRHADSIAAKCCVGEVRCTSRCT